MPNTPDEDKMLDSLFRDLLEEGPLTVAERREMYEDDYNADDYESPSGGSGKWTISALKAARNLGEATDEDNCAYRGILYGTSQEVSSYDPEDFVTNNDFTTWGRKMYYALGDMRKTWIDQSLTDPNNPLQLMFKSGLENGVSAVLQHSGKETLIGNQLVKEGNVGKLEKLALNLLRPNSKHTEIKNISPTQP